MDGFILDAPRDLRDRYEFLPPELRRKKDGWTFKPASSSWKLDDAGAMLTARHDDDGSLTQSRYKEIDVSGKPVLSYIGDYL